jgi:hypothetical protein
MFCEYLLSPSSRVKLYLDPSRWDRHVVPKFQFQITLSRLITQKKEEFETGLFRETIKPLPVQRLESANDEKNEHGSD